ncbi:putative transcriptional regulatory protein [Neolecta irregularis DAH-3]|uniref:Putative transcriptional regulatory protein n=1 Tax=Neolecta irregularis (strain DAH-3) TaxID=1198029 RepID=A0A1U7LM97_NEOID|nr:putative transcriptional regulatory protein [Neolecta irregularis DAH-3]|eukprot:OLL23784.1 putative transcriptional regulatory protein [Neolecta irregularis DAH-3]
MKMSSPVKRRNRVPLACKPCRARRVRSTIIVDDRSLLMRLSEAEMKLAALSQKFEHGTTTSRAPQITNIPSTSLCSTNEQSGPGREDHSLYDYAQPDSPPISVSIAEDVVKESFGRLTVLESGAQRYHGNMSSRLCESSPELEILSVPVWSLKGESKRMDIHSDVIRNIIVKFLPPRTITDILVYRYYAVNEWARFELHQTFLAEYNQFWETLEASPFWIALLLAVISVSLRAYPREDHPDIVALHASLGYDRLSYRLEVQQAIADCLHYGRFMDNYDLDVVRTLVLNQKNADIITPSMVVSSIGLLITMAQSLGLHRNPEILGFTGYEAEYRKRLWQVIFSYDSIGAWHSGQPLHINHDDMDCPLPTYNIEYDGENREWLEFCVTLGKLLLLDPYLYKALFSRKKVSYSRILELDAELQKWDTERPTWLRLDGSEKDPYKMWRQIVLEGAFTRLCLCLHLPYIRRSGFEASQILCRDIAQRAMRMLCVFDQNERQLEWFRWMGQIWMMTVPLISTLVVATDLVAKASKDAESWALVDQTHEVLRRLPEFRDNKQATVAIEVIERIRVDRLLSTDVLGQLDPFAGFEPVFGWDWLQGSP